MNLVDRAKDIVLRPRTEWSAVDRGHHGFTAFAYALPSGFDLNRFARDEAASIEVTAVAIKTAD